MWCDVHFVGGHNRGDFTSNNSNTDGQSRTGFEGKEGKWSNSRMYGTVQLHLQSLLLNNY